MIYLLSDLHGDFRIFTKKARLRSKYQLTKEDYVIVLGDFGLAWADDKQYEQNCKWLSSLPFTILFIDGNHENHDMLESYPIEIRNGGKIHKISDNIFHLMRGQIFSIEGYSFFTMGGASSHDIEGGVLDRSAPDFKAKKLFAKKNHLNYRILGESWWSQELPSQQEYAEGLRNLAKADFKVDFILSHQTPIAQQKILIAQGQLDRIENNALTEYFEFLEEKVNFKQWFSGHVHIDAVMDIKHTIVYHELVPLNKFAALMDKISQDAMTLEVSDYGNED